MSAADGSVVGFSKIVDHGDPTRRWNVALLAEGYRRAELAKFAADAAEFADALRREPPFTALAAGVNVFRVDVESIDSGADDPLPCGPGTSARTYFDASYCGDGSIRRLLVADRAAAEKVAIATLPAHPHAVLVVVNSPEHGGSGGQVGVFSTAPGWTETALHELGHSAFGLADEYPYYVGCGLETDRDVHPALEPSEPNVTTETRGAFLKWRALVSPSTPLPTQRNPDCTRCDDRPSTVPPGTVGLFEGAHYHHCGAFRPEHACKMRELGEPFCAVCRARIARALAPFQP